ncbi:MAG: oligosaccharide repeat unit polymerase, partial [Flavobacterium sp.]|nr:oligosaccharide repeat unit polymerase [Flavobacterium sp.]
MTNIYNFSKNVFLDIKQENRNNPVFIFVILILITIPLALILNSVLIGLMAIFTFFYFKKINFKIDKELFLGIILYLLMLLSMFWTIDSDRTASAIIKEIPLLIIPICFLCFKPFTETQKNKIIQYYSYGIFLLTIFYLLKATLRFFISNNNEVFFYHELVTKEVNAIHVSVYVAIAFFYFFTKPIKKILDFVILAILFLMVFLLSSKNIIVVFLGLIVIYHLFYSKLSHQLRLKNLILVGVILISFTFIGRIKDRFKQEYETIMTDSTVNDVISKNNEIVYNVSIKQAWTNTIFRANDYFPGTAFRVYQFRIFLEMMKEN